MVFVHHMRRKRSASQTPPADGVGGWSSSSFINLHEEEKECCLCTNATSKSLLYPAKIEVEHRIRNANGNVCSCLVEIRGSMHHIQETTDTKQITSSTTYCR